MLRDAFESGDVSTASELERKLDELGLEGSERTRVAALAVGTEPKNFVGATLAQLMEALQVDEATLRATAEKEITRIVAVAPELTGVEEVRVWMNEPTAPELPPPEIKRHPALKVADAISQAINIAIEPLGQAVRKASANRYDRRAKKAVVDPPKEVSIGRGAFCTTKLSSTQLNEMAKNARENIDALLECVVKISDPETGKKRPLTRRDIADVHLFLTEALAVLPELPITTVRNGSLSEVLADSRVAGFLMSHRKGSDIDAAFLGRHRLTLSVLELAGVRGASKRALKNAEIVLKGQAKFNEQVRELVSGVPSVISITDREEKIFRLDRGHLTDLVAATRPLVDGLADLPVPIEDPVTGMGRVVNAEDIAATHRILGLVTTALADNVIQVDERTLSLDSILAKPEVAARILKHAAPENQAKFQVDYQRAIGTLLAQRQAYCIETSWPALTDPQDPKAAESSGPVVVAVRRQPPTEVLKAMETLTHRYFQGITHLWFDGLMGDDEGRRAETEKRLSAVLDGPGKALLAIIVKYRDEGASRMVAVDRGRYLPRIEAGLRSSLSDLTRSIAMRTARSAYYCGVGEDVAKEVLKVVGIGTVIGRGLDFGSMLLENPAIEFWKPTVLGGWDDVLGGWVNIRELMGVADKFSDLQVRENLRGGALIDGTIAVGAGISSSVALGLPLAQLGFPLVAGKSLGEAMLAPGVDALTRAGAAAFYGAASSGATAVLSVLPARHHVRPILDLVEKGVVEHPTFRGKKLNGEALKAWAIKNAVQAHLSYTAQFGGALGVATSALFMAAASPVLALPSALTVNLVLSLGGAFETITTGVVLFGRKKWDDRGVRRTFHKAISSLNDRAPSTLRGLSAVPALGSS